MNPQLQEVLFTIFVIIGLFNFVHIGLYLAGANLYDMWQFNRKRQGRTRHSKRPYLPRVSVIIPAHNEEKAIVRCLESVYANTYTNFEIIVVNDGSKDNTSKKVRSFIRRTEQAGYMGRKPRSFRLERRTLPPRATKVLTTLVDQPNAGKGAAVNNGIKNHAKGSLIMTLDADSILHPEAIERAVSYFKNPKIVGVAANVRIMDEPTVLGLLQKFEHMIGYRSKKFYTVTNSEFIVGGVASTYRRGIMRKVGLYDTDTMTEDIGLSMKVTDLGNRQHKIVYAVDVVAMTEGVQTFKQLLRQRYRWKMGILQNLLKHRHMIFNNDIKYSRMLTMYRIPVAFISELLLLLQPLFISYVLYLTFLYQTTGLIIGAYLVVTLYSLWTIWPDEHANARRKISLSIYGPVLYFIFYIMDAIQVYSIIKCLFNPKLVRRMTEQDGTWISPDRSGAHVQIA